MVHGEVISAETPLIEHTSGWKQWTPALRSPWLVAFLALLVYGVWFGGMFARGTDVRDFIIPGRKFILQSHASAVITIDPHYTYVPNNIGYDGQWSYYIALDPLNARYYLDLLHSNPDYRYSRILYPIVARLVGLGQPAIIPYALIAVNWLAVGGGTLAIAAWLRRKGCSPWLALIYSFYIGLFIGLERDLTEPLAYALAAVGMYLFTYGGQRRVLWAAGSFALAMLTRETTVIFPLICAATLMLTSSSTSSLRARLASGWRPALEMLSVAFLPYAVYRVVLRMWLGVASVPGTVQPTLIPFSGILAYWPWPPEQQNQVLVVIVPALICLGMCLWAFARHLQTLEIWLLLANVLVLVVFRPPDSYVDIYGSGRIALGVVLSALYCVPIFARLTPKRPYWLVLCAALWLLMTPLALIGRLLA